MTKAEKKKAVRRSRVQLNRLLVSAISELTSKSRGFVINYRSRNCIHYVYSDREQLGGVLQRIIGYAFKFMRPNGEVRIAHERLTSNRFDDKSDYVLVAVQICGRGISEEMLQTITDSFQHMTVMLDENCKPDNDFILSYCREFIRSTGGNLWVRSELGQGLFFYFTLPLAKEIEIKHRQHPATFRRVRVIPDLAEVEEFVKSEP